MQVKNQILFVILKFLMFFKSYSFNVFNDLVSINILWNKDFFPFLFFVVLVFGFPNKNTMGFLIS